MPQAEFPVQFSSNKSPARFSLRKKEGGRRTVNGDNHRNILRAELSFPMGVTVVADVVNR